MPSASPITGSTPNVRYVALDGLRGWAALGVVCWHLFVEVFPYSVKSKSFLLIFTPINGFVAVYLFFVISGFSLAISFVRRRDVSGLARLAVGRYPRLALPVLAICILLYLSIVTGITPPANGQPAPLTGFPAFTPTLAYIFQFSLFDVFFRYSLSGSLIGPLWTMPIEIAGSALVLGLLALVGRWRKRMWIYGAVAIILIGLDSIYILFVSGLIFAEISEWWVPGSRLEKSALIILLIFGLSAPALTQNRPSILFFLLVVGLCASVFWLPKLHFFFERPVSRFLGHVSFPLYLVQGPLLHSFSVWTWGWISPFNLTPSITNLAVCLISLPVFLLVAVAFTPINDGAIIFARKFGAFVVEKALLLK